MLSFKTTSRLLLSFALLLAFLVGSTELRVAVGTIFLWSLGLIIHRRRSLSPKFIYYHTLLGLLLLCLLLAKNELFYENTLGRIFDIFFPRPSYNSATPGSGFTDWHEQFARRHHHSIDFAWRFFHFAVRSTFVAVALPCIVFLCHWYAAFSQRLPGLTDTIEYHDRTGELPPWIFGAQVQAPESLPKRDTRYLQLSDDLGFVVVAGDYDGAISRRRGLSKEFA